MEPQGPRPDRPHVPCPLTVSDSIPSVMIPQWHRGTEWARDAAKKFHDEVAERRRPPEHAVCQPERARLMWIGRGLWFNMGFYQHFQDAYGAVFVWSMYLAIAADGYIRYGDDQMRALAGRFAAFSDQLYAPPWSAEWYVKEAKLHGIDGVVHLVSDDPRGSYFTTHALEAAGIPVLELHSDNVDSRDFDQDAVFGTVGQWLDDPGPTGRRPATRRLTGDKSATSTPAERRSHAAIRRG